MDPFLIAAILPHQGTHGDPVGDVGHALALAAPGLWAGDVSRMLLEAACAETGRSRGEIVRDALRRQLQLMRFERLRRQALPYGEAAGWLTDDDVFAAIS